MDGDEEEEKETTDWEQQSCKDVDVSYADIMLIVESIVQWLLENGLRLIWCDDCAVTFTLLYDLLTFQLFYGLSHYAGLYDSDKKLYL